MGHQSYVLLCSEITNFLPSEGVSEITFGSIQSRPPWIVIIQVYWYKLIILCICFFPFSYFGEHMCSGKNQTVSKPISFFFDENKFLSSQFDSHRQFYLHFRLNGITFKMSNSLNLYNSRFQSNSFNFKTTKKSVARPLERTAVS